MKELQDDEIYCNNPEHLITNWSLAASITKLIFWVVMLVFELYVFYRVIRM